MLPDSPDGDQAGQPAPIPAVLQGAVLELNNAHATELSLLDAAGLAALLQGAFFARRVGALDGFLLALDEAHPEYRSPNYLWFRARFPRFAYIDRVVVASAARRQGVAARLYAGLARHASAAGHHLLACEVNADPPNPASDAFHAALGFVAVGEAAIHGGAKTVRYLTRQL